MPQTMGTSQDVVAFLKEQHEQIKAMFQQVADTAGEDREKAFLQLRRLLAVHETAEEEIVHPLAREALAERGPAVVAERLEEERRAKEVLRDLEDLGVDTAEFGALFDELRGAVLAHAEAEEQQEFAALARELDDAELQRTRRAVEFAEKTAPTRPHPGVESAVGNMVVGPFAMMLDRARDAISGKG
ncbi:MAG TPA: hemerythrin domain-containing protein [Sporichthyaceae bacterium]|jgi:hemerythrin superfamily protein